MRSRIPHPAPSATNGWIDAVNLRGTIDVGVALGLTDTRNSLSPCPSCKAVKRSSSERSNRGPIGVGTDGQWKCFRCVAKGSDAVSLAALVVAGEKLDAGDPRWHDVQRACDEHGLLGADAAPATRQAPIRPNSANLLPPREEVLALWRAARPVTQDEAAAEWLKSRGLEPAAVEDRSLARAIPDDIRVPKWAWAEGEFWNRGRRYKLLLPLVDSHGRLASVRARAITLGRPKEVAPAGFGVGGLVFADDLAARMLAGDVSAISLVSRVGLVIVEGAPDFLTWATRYSDSAEAAPAVVGVFAGSWSPEVAGKIPAGCRVSVRTHLDAEGDKYAADIIASLHQCVVTRPRRDASRMIDGRTMDENDRHQAKALPAHPDDDSDVVADQVTERSMKVMAAQSVPPTHTARAQREPGREGPRPPRANGRPAPTAPTYFVKVPFEAFDTDLLAAVGPTLLVLYWLLRRYVWRQDVGSAPVVRLRREGWIVARVRQALLAQKLGVRQARTVRHDLQRMVELGWIGEAPGRTGETRVYVLGRLEGTRERYFFDQFLARLSAHLRNADRDDLTPEDRLRLVHDFLDGAEPQVGASGVPEQVRASAPDGGVAAPLPGASQRPYQGRPDAHIEVENVEEEKSELPREREAPRYPETAPGKDMAEDGVAEAGPARVERAWREAVQAAFPGIPFAAWGRREIAQAAKLLALYTDPEVVVSAVRHVVTEWSDIQARFLKGQGGVPSLGFLLRFHAELVPEAGIRRGRATVDAEWDRWFAEHPNEPPPPDLVARRHTSAAKAATRR